MKKVQSLVMAVMMVLMLFGVANADWNEGDPHKMHWPQLPFEIGVDVMASEPFILADDFQCTETGTIRDIHFWGSWRGGWIPGLSELFGFWISLHEDIPANQNPQGPWSKPGAVLLNNFYPIEAFIVAGPFPGEQGWYDPVQGLLLPFDHFEYFQYNLYLPEQDWVHQTQGNIYWLNISAVVLDPIGFPWGWKQTRPDLQFLDNSVWTDQFMYPADWFPIDDLQFGGPLDLAFVITGEPDCPPVDSDQDGIYDCNDNCPNHPNGPSQGTCTATVGPNQIVSTGQFCTVDGDCDVGEFCEKVQADNYPPGGNGIGDACECEANFDCDTDVDANDVTAFLFDFGRSIFFNPCTNASPCNGDFLCDVDVDANDVAKFLEDFGRSAFFLPCPICPGGPWCSYP